MLCTWELLRRWAKRRATNFIQGWMAALPPPAEGGGADDPPQPGRTGPPPLGTPHFRNKMISCNWSPYNMNFFFQRNNVFIREAEGGGGGGERDRPAWLVTHHSVGMTAPPPCRPTAGGHLASAMRRLRPILSHVPRPIGWNQCWYSPFVGGQHQQVWGGYEMAIFCCFLR